MIVFLFSLLFGGHEPTWIFIFCAAIIAAFVPLLGFVIWTIIYASTPEQREAAYKIFRALIGLFRRKRSCGESHRHRRSGWRS